MNDFCWIVYGCSPFIRSIDEKIPYLLENYRSIGINVFPAMFKGCEYWIFNDNGIFTNIVRKNYHGEKLVMNKNLVPELKMKYFRSGQCVIGDSFLIKPHYVFEGTDDVSLSDTGKLLYLNNSVLSALNFTLINGAEKVILAGVDLFPTWEHFYGGRGKDKNPCYIELIKKQIKLFCNYTDVFKLNKFANIDVDFINVDIL